MIPLLESQSRQIASCNPICPQTTKAKKRIKPIPGANAKGSLAQKAMTTVAITDAKAVAVNNAPLSIPVVERISGLTASMYAMVIKW